MRRPLLLEVRNDVLHDDQKLVFYSLSLSEKLRPADILGRSDLDFDHKVLPWYLSASSKHVLWSRPSAVPGDHVGGRMKNAVRTYTSAVFDASGAMQALVGATQGVQESAADTDVFGGATRAAAMVAVASLEELQAVGSPGRVLCCGRGLPYPASRIRPTQSRVRLGY